MTYITFEPLKQFDNLNKTFNRVFGEFPSTLKFDTSYNLKTDIYEDENNYYVEAEVSGVKKENIKISLHENTITISGEKISASNKDEKKKYISRERNFGAFSRSFNFHERINPENTEAKFQDGILTVTIEKFKKTAKEKVINIQ